MLPALLALLALLLLPGLALVAAPWPAVPLLSVAFWLAAWGLTDLLGLSREAALRSTLLLFGLLALLRLPRLPPWPRRSAAALAVLLTGALGLAGATLARLPEGPAAPGLALSARLLTDRDGWPATQAPFWSGRAFEPPPGLSLLAADVSLLSGAPVATALLLAALAARGLLALALLLAIRRLAWPSSAWPAAALLPWLLHAVRPLAADPAELALALGLAGWSLLASGVRRAPAAAGGLLLAGAVSAEARVGGLALLAGAMALGLAWRNEKRQGRAERLARAATAVAVFGAGSLALRHGWAVAGEAHVALAGAAVACAGLASRRAWPRAFALLLLPVALAAVVRAGSAARTPGLDDHDLAAMAWLRDETPLTARVLVSDPLRAAWLPALAERRPCGPGERCSFVYRRVDEAAAGPACFRAGPAQVVEIP